MKRYTSDVETKRLTTEELNTTSGHVIVPQQIWRDGSLIPGSPSDITSWTAFTADTNDNGDDYTFRLYTLKDGQTVNKLIKFVQLLPLQRVAGTSNVFYDSCLKNLIGRQFDSDSSDASKSWQYKIFIDGSQLSYDAGDPFIDIAAGTLKFRSESFVASLASATEVKVTFYKYVGRFGFVGATSDSALDDYAGFDLPIRDDVKHFKDADSDSRTAQFVLDGDDTNSVYILPKTGETFHANSNYELKSTGAYSTSKDNTSGVIMLEENYQDIDWNIGWHNGGVWLPDGTVNKQ